MARINSRTKGSKNERKLAKLFETWTGKKFSRTPSSGGLHWKNSQTSGDIVATTEGFFFPFSIECKNHREINFEHLLYLKEPKIWEFWDQCQRDANGGTVKKIPLLFMRYNGMPSDLHFVCMEEEFFRFCLKPFLPIDFKYLEIPLTQGESGVILSSDLFFEFPYKRLARVFKNYLVNKDEIFKDLPGNDQYEVSNRGYIRVKQTGLEIYGNTTFSNLYPRTVLRIDGKKKTIKVAKLVAKLFVKKGNGKDIINHIDGARWESDARNLEWVTYQENTQHYYDLKNYGYYISQQNLKGEELGKFRSPIQAARSLGRESGSPIVKVLNGKAGRNTCYGFKWKKINTQQGN